MYYFYTVHSISVLFYAGSLMVSAVEEKTGKCLRCVSHNCPESNRLCQNESGENSSNKAAYIFQRVKRSPPEGCHISPGSRVKTRDCFSLSGKVPCDQPLPVGTLVSFTCPDFFTARSTLSLCLADSSWTEPIECIPECGRVFPKAGLVPLIRYGKEVSAGQWPWVAALYHKTNDQWKLNCGGTLISDNAIITAAHCVWNYQTRNMLFTLGHLPRNLQKDTDPVYRIEKVFILPIYKHDLNFYNSDIAVVILTTPVKFSENVLPACLPEGNSTVAPYTSGIVAGWGSNEKQELLPTLNYIEIPIVNTTTCLNTVPDQYTKYLSYTTFCAGYTNGTGACNGDSGNGMLTRVDGHWVLQGVVSNSPRDSTSNFCHPNNFAAFTKVKLFVEWIQKVMKIEENK